MKNKVQVYVYQCTKCHNVLQSEEELGKCECGADDWCCLDEECDGILQLRCHCFKSCGCCSLCDEHDEFYMDENVDGMREN